MAFQPNNSDIIHYNTTLNSTFIVDTGLVAIGTAETPLLLLRNPAASGITMNIYKYSFGTEAGKPTYVRIYAKPTVTSAGTALTPACIRQTSAAQATSVVTAFKSPTISANGTLMKTFIINNSGNIGAGNPGDFIGNFLFGEGSDFLITCQNQTNGTNSQACCEYGEI